MVAKISDSQYSKSTKTISYNSEANLLSKSLMKMTHRVAYQRKRIPSERSRFMQKNLKCGKVSQKSLFFFFYQGFLSRTLTAHRTAGEGRGPSYSSLQLPPAHEHSDIYLQLWTWDDYHIFLIVTLVFTRLLLDEIYHLIELLFHWLMWYWFLFTCLLNWF